MIRASSDMPKQIDCSGRLFKNAPMQGAQKLQEGGVCEKYVE